MSKWIDDEFWPCPFCNKETILIRNIKSVTRTYKTSWGGSKPGIKKSRPQIIIRVEKCSNCNKSTEEIEKKWKEEGYI
jgi:hypothetical protein